MKILIPIDGSTASDEAVSQVIEQVKATGTEIELLYVVDPFPEKLARNKGREGFPDFASARNDLRAFAEQLLTSAAERLLAAGFGVNSSIQEGDVRALILERAKAWHADLIVVGSHPPSGIRHFFVSSISQYVSREATCSVEIVRTRNCAQGVQTPDYVARPRGPGSAERGVHFACRKAGD